MAMPRCIACLLFAAMVSVAVAGPADDLVAAVANGDFNTVLQQVGHGTSPNDANAKGQIPLVLAGAIALTLACQAVREFMRSSKPPGLQKRLDL